jgi:hypothetical protein
MKKLLITFLLIFSSVIWSADLNKGFDAYYSMDFNTALIELKPFAEQGNMEAQAMLGEIYWFGMAGEINNILAFMWFSIAASQGDEFSAESRDSVGEIMTPDEISTAKKLANKCILLNYKCANLEKQTNTEKSRKIKDSGVFFNHVASDVGVMFDGKWVYLGNNSSGDNYYGEINTIKENDGSIYWWFLVDNMKPHQQGYISFRGYQEVDCGRNRSKTLQYVFYKEPMGVSEIGRMTPSDEWEYSTTDSMGYNMVRWVCSQV